MLSFSQISSRLLRFSFSRQVNYYSVLGVSPESTQQQIKNRYYKLAKLHHPDTKTSTNQQQFIKIKQAYNIIGNISTRGDYDRKIRRQEETGRQRQHQYYQAEINRKYTNQENSKMYSKRHKYAVRLGLFSLFCSAVYFMFGLRANNNTDYEVRKNNMILSKQNVNSTKGVIQKRRKLLEQQRKQKKFDIVPINLHFDLYGNAYMNQENIKSSKKRNSKKDKKSKDLSDMPGIRKKHQKKNPEQRQFDGQYI